MIRWLREPLKRRVRSVSYTHLSDACGSCQYSGLFYYIQFVLRCKEIPGVPGRFFALQRAGLKTKPGAHQRCAPAFISAVFAAVPRDVYKRQPLWWWMCQLFRQPGSKATLAMGRPCQSGVCPGLAGEVGAEGVGQLAAHGEYAGIVRSGHRLGLALFALMHWGAPGAVSYTHLNYLGMPGMNGV